MKPIRLPPQSPDQLKALKELYHTTKDIRLRTRSQMMLLAAGRLVLLYLPTYSPWLNPIEMLWRQFRREVTHCELFASVKALLVATQTFFNRYNQKPDEVLSIIGSNAA